MYQVIEVQFDEWEYLYSQTLNSPLLQSWQYGQAKQNTSKWKVKRFKVVDQKGEPVALAQFLVFEFAFFGGVARLNRGPIMIYESGRSGHNFSLIVKSLMHYAQKRRWWMVQIAPEIKQSEENEEMLFSLSLRKLSSPPAGSALLYLKNNEEDLLKGLKKKWRYSLRKAQEKNLTITRADCIGNDFSKLQERYKAMKDMREFSGLSNSLLDSLAEQRSRLWSMDLFYANEHNKTGAENSLGMLISVRHGDTATYLVGVTEDAGRQLQVNYLLLWKAILAAKFSGCKWFDLGGLDATTPEGIAHFKRGINAVPYSLIGEWRCYLHPWRRW